jgi:hypothetical protein
MHTLSLKYDSYALVKINGHEYPHWNILNKTKTIKNNQGFSFKEKFENIKVSPRTYWDVNSWNNHFESSDTHCWLCDYHGSTDYDCNCPPFFTIEEHKENLQKVRKNFLLAYCKKHLPEKVEQVEKLTPEQIYNIICESNKDGVKQIVYMPNNFAPATEIEKINNHIKNKLK